VVVTLPLAALVLVLIFRRRLVEGSTRGAAEE
jgi:uncharacterized protein (TIGR03382 family)